MTEASMSGGVARAKPAVAAKIMVTGVSLSSVLAMTAAMGSASTNDVDESPLSVVTPENSTAGTTITSLVSIGVAPMSLPPDFLVDPSPTGPIVAEVVSTPPPAPIVPASPGSHAPAPDPVEPVTIAPAPPPAATPVAAPTPIIVQVPAPAPAPSASTNKSR